LISKGVLENISGFFSKKNTENNSVVRQKNIEQDSDEELSNRMNKLALAQTDISKKDSEILSLNSELSELKTKLTLEASDITETPAAVWPSQKEQAKPRISDSPLLCDGTTESVVGGDVQLEEAEFQALGSSESQENASNTRDSQIVDPDPPEFSLRFFLVERPKKPSLETVVPLKSGEFKDPSIKSSTNAPSVQVSTDKSSTSSPPATQSRTAVNDLRKFSTGSTVIEKDNVDSKERSSMLPMWAVRLENRKNRNRSALRSPSEKKIFTKQSHYI
ncbi:3882_t:CDS:2, partial [Paraglomus occultum]